MIGSSRRDCVRGGDETPTDVARQIRLHRTRRNLSQRALAKASGLSRNTLSLLESGRTSPTVSTLQKLAKALRIDVAAFFEPFSDKNIVLSRAGRSPMLTLTHGSLLDLGMGMESKLATPLVLQLKPGARSASELSHDGQVFIYCLSGELSFTFDEQRYELEAGDSLLFDGHLTHCYEVTSAEGAEALVVLSLPGHKKRVPLLENLVSLLGQAPIAR